jgi:hypothetical protein
MRDGYCPGLDGSTCDPSQSHCSRMCSRMASYSRAPPHFASAGSIYLEHEAACQSECQLLPLIFLLPEMASRITCSLQLARISSPGSRSPCGCDVVASCCPAKSYLFLA